VTSSKRVIADVVQEMVAAAGGSANEEKITLPSPSKSKKKHALVARGLEREEGAQKTVEF